MKSPVVKRSIVLAGHKTSVSLEDAFWAGLKEIAGKRVMTLSDLVGTIELATPTRQSFVGSPPVRAGVLSQPDSRHRARGSSSDELPLRAGRDFIRNRPPPVMPITCL